MRITIHNVELLPEDGQQSLGQKILLQMYYQNVKVDGVVVEFAEDDELSNDLPCVLWPNS